MDIDLQQIRIKLRYDNTGKWWEIGIDRENERGGIVQLQKGNTLSMRIGCKDVKLSVSPNREYFNGGNSEQGEGYRTLLRNELEDKEIKPPSDPLYYNGILKRDSDEKYYRLIFYPYPH